jgi:glycosyltransferase involved in cell wall biosynthesis
MQVVHSLQLGGSERLACDLARSLDPGKVQSSVCAIDLDGPLGEELAQAGLPFYVMGREPRLDCRLIPRLYSLFRHTGTQVVQTHHLTQLIYAGLGARLAGAALVHVEHDYFSLAAPRRKRLLRGLGRLCHRVVAVGDEIGHFLTRQVGLRASRVMVIPNGVDLARYSPTPRVRRDALGLPLGRRLVGHVGRLDPLKDQPSLLRAFRLVAAEHPDTHLVIAGDGPLRGDLEQLAASLGIRERVLLLGSRGDVADLLPHFEIFVMASLSEGLPLSILEAMACARPVVATGVGDIPGTVQDGVSGVIVPPGRPEGLAAALSGLLTSSARAAAFGHAGRLAAERRFSFRSTVQQYEALYRSLPVHRQGPSVHASTSGAAPVGRP